jgi:CubicO group peptidase (beta-lactamase class C family)
MVLNHQAGLAALREPVPENGLCDWDAVVEALAAMEPLWEPGTRHGYHALVFGHLVGEVLRRVTGRSLGTFFRTEVAEPLGLDFWIGLPEEHEARVASSISPDPPAPDQPLPPFYAAAMTDPTSIPGMVLMNSGGILSRSAGRSAASASSPRTWSPPWARSAPPSRRTPRCSCRPAGRAGS